MPKMRIMSWVLFTLSLAFFFVQDFRWALRMPYLEMRDFDRWMVPQEKLRALAESARQRREAQALAFAAFHLESDDRISLANQAVALDPSLTWIYYDMAHGLRERWTEPALAATLQDWQAKLEAFDSQNAAPYLLRAELIRQRTKDFPGVYGGSKETELQLMSKQTEWLAAMERAFTAPRYDTYNARRFNLDRSVLIANGWATPERIFVFAAVYPVPNLLNIRNYANYRVKYLAPKAEREKRHDEALRQYYSAALFGQRMQVESTTLIEQLIGVAVDRIASEPLEAALRKDGQTDQAELVAFSHRRFVRDHPKEHDPLAASSNQIWAAITAHVFAFLVAAFSLLTLLAFLYLNAKRWIRVEKRGSIFQFVTGGVNYLAVLLFTSCLGLFLVYAPYAANFHHYMTAKGEVRDREAVFFNVYPFLLWDWLDFRATDIPPGNPFGSYFYWAGGGLVLLALVGWLKKRFEAAPAPAAAK